MKSWGWFLPSVAVHCMYLCQSCSAFVHLASRLPTELSVRRHQALWSVYLRSPPPPLPLAQSTRPKKQTAAPRWPFSPLFGGGKGIGVEDDPFRPERASISPMVINALVPVLFKETGAADAVAAVLRQRRNSISSSSSDWKLTGQEEAAVTERVCGVEANLMELRFMLATAVERTPSIAKYGMLSDYGVSDDVEENPLAQMNQAECLLALYMLHKEKGWEEDGGGGGDGGRGRRPSAVDFLDADKLEVLGGGSKA